MGYTIFHAGELDWQHRREGDPRLVAYALGLDDAVARDLFRDPPGAFGRRHIDPIQEEVFVVLDGTLTIHMGEGDEPAARTSSRREACSSSSPAPRCSSRTGHDEELHLFIVGAPPERGEAVFRPNPLID